MDALSSHNTRRPKEKIAESLRHQLRQRDDGQWVWNTDPKIAEVALFRAREPPQIMRDISAQIEVPTLIVRGEKSDVLDMERARSLGKLIATSCVVEVPNAGHSVVGDNPVDFLSHLRTFLKDKPKL